jgi:glycosyltransferase domain-containing protein
MVNNATILLLLKDRSEFTKRWLHVHNDINFNIPVHIADGSLNDCNERIISDFISRKNNLNITYKHYGKDISLHKFYSKIVTSVKDIESQYVIFTCNDDFLIEKSIIEGAEFLNENSEYVAAAGPIYDTAISQTHPSHNNVWGALSHPTNQYPAFNRLENNPETRIYQFLSGRKNSYIWTALHRRNVIIETSKVIQEISPPDLRFQSHLMSLLTLGKGKVSGALPCMTLHQSNPGESAGHDLMQKASWYQWIQSKEWFECFNKMTQAVVDQISPNNKLGQEDLKRLIEIYYQAFVGQMNIREFHPTYKAELFSEGLPLLKSNHIFEHFKIIKEIIENKIDSSN